VRWRGPAHPKATDEQTGHDPDAAALVAGYEQLRAAALAGAGAGHGLVVLVTGGMAAWIAACRSLHPSPAPPLRPAASPPVGVAADGVVAVLASMAAACLVGG
jgi:hypothetical protein